MEISFDAITFVHLAGVIVGIVSSAVILYFGFKTNPVNQPLGIGQLSASLGIFVSFSIVSQLILQWPFLYRWGNVFILIFIPMPYLYTVFYTGKRLWKWYDLLHGIPLLIYFIDFWDVLWMSSEEKTHFMLQEIKNLDLSVEFRQSKFIGPRFHQEFRTILFSGYWVAQIIILIRWVRGQSILTHENKVWRNWMILFLGCQFFMWFPFFLTVLWLDKLTTYHIVNSFSVGWVVLSSLSLFFFPSLLYGKPFEGGDRISKLTKALKKPQISEAEEKKLEDVMQIIDSYMETERLFLKMGYTINDFSKDIHIPVYQISKSLNTFKDMGFVDYTNHMRVHYCLKKFKEGVWSNYTIEAIAGECGFNNRNSFTNAFKKFLGTSPSEYRENFHKS